MMATPIQTKPVFSIGQTRALFDVSQIVLPNQPTLNFDISPDGKHFIMIRNIGYDSSTTKFNVILNWNKEMTARFGERN